MITFKWRRYYIDKKKPFPAYDWKAGERTAFNIDVDGDNIVVNGYSMPVKEDKRFTYTFTWSCKKTFIRAQGGAEGLYKFLDGGKDNCWTAYVGDIVNWVVTFGKKQEVTA